MYHTIILSGGASRGFYQMGCLYKHWNDIQGVSRYIGCSVGGMICLMLMCGHDVPRILRDSLAANIDFRNTWSSMSVRQNIVSAVTAYGIMDINPYIRIIESIVMHKYGIIPTLAQLHELTGKELILVGSCLTTHDVVYLSHHTYPDMPVTVAVDITTRVPIFFTPILYGGHLYVDGGLCEHFPISQAVSGEKTLAIYTCGKTYDTISSIRDIPPHRYLWILVHTATKHKYKDMRSTEDIDMYVIKGKGGDMYTTVIDAIRMFLEGTEVYKSN